MSARAVTVLRVDEELAAALDKAADAFARRHGLLVRRTAVAAAAIRLGLRELEKTNILEARGLLRG